MPSTRYRRQFTAGSRPAPDPYDQFLEPEGFYRKHTARDATCLFRVVSEQVFDTQLHHQQLRKDCVNFMIKHRDQYEQEVKGDFDQYIREMAKQKTFGTLLELRALGYLFKRNILLFKPFDFGNWLVHDDDYKEPILRVFFAPDKHFDSIFTKPQIIKAAFCQSIVYETLYKNVYKLCDIEYSVEMMLHGVNEKDGITYSVFARAEYANNDDYASHIVFDDGRKFELDRPENTSCILEDSSLCHFHNKDFDSITKRLNTGDSNYLYTTRKILSASLPDKYNSCVRQLLNDGITPFPYKVAKSLDPDIYRNIEFDSWNDHRKTQKKSGRDFVIKVGAKCLVKLNETQDDFYVCHIQEINSDKGQCVVFVEKFGEKRTISHSSLKPLNDADRSSKQMRTLQRVNDNRFVYEDVKQSYDEFESGNRKALFDKSYGEKSKFNDSAVDSFDYSNYLNESDFSDAIEGVSNFKHYTSLANFQPYNPYEIIALPMVYSNQSAPNMTANSATSNNNSDNNNGGKGVKVRGNAHGNHMPQQQDNKQQVQAQLPKTEEEHNFHLKNAQDASHEKHPPQFHHQLQPNQAEQPIDNNGGQLQMQHNPPNTSFYPQSTGQMMPYYPAQSTFDENPYYVPADMMHQQPGVYTVSNIYSTTPMPANSFPAVPPNQMTYQYPVPVHTNWPHYNPPINAPGYVLPTPIPVQYSVPAFSPMPITQIPRDLLVSNGPVNLSANFSHSRSCEDLPLNDKPTMRFFYNLGIEYYKQVLCVYGSHSITAMFDEPCGPCEQVPPNEDECQQNQLNVDFHQMNLDSGDRDGQTPSKGKNYSGEFNGRLPRNGNARYKYRDGKPNSTPRHQGSYSGAPPKMQNYAKGGPRNNNYEGTPLKESQQRSHQSNGDRKQRVDRDSYPNENASIVFGSNVPPYPTGCYPFSNFDQSSNDQFGQPPHSAGFAYATPPVVHRPNGPHEPNERNEMQNSGYYQQNPHQVHHIQAGYHPMNAQNCWYAGPNQHQQQSSQHQQQNSLNTSTVSNVSSGTNTASNPSQ